MVFNRNKCFCSFLALFVSKKIFKFVFLMRPKFVSNFFVVQSRLSTASYAERDPAGFFRDWICAATSLRCFLRCSRCLKSMLHNLRAANCQAGPSWAMAESGVKMGSADLVFASHLGLDFSDGFGFGFGFGTRSGGSNCVLHPHKKCFFAFAI